MIELGELEAKYQEFERRQVRVIAISSDKLEDAAVTQPDFPHLVIVSDADQNMAKAMQILHKGAGAKGDDTNAPTSFLVDGDGTVRWLYRPDRFIVRLTPAQVLAAIDETWPSR